VRKSFRKDLGHGGGGCGGGGGGGGWGFGGGRGVWGGGGGVGGGGVNGKRCESCLPVGLRGRPRKKEGTTLERGLLGKFSENRPHSGSLGRAWKTKD